MEFLVKPEQLRDINLADKVRWFLCILSEHVSTLQCLAFFNMLGLFNLQCMHLHIYQGVMFAIMCEQDAEKREKAKAKKEREMARKEKVYFIIKLVFDSVA